MIEQIRALVAPYDLDAIEAEGGVVWVVSPDMRIVYVNERWFSFARENDGEPAISERWSVGANLLDALPEVLRESYLRAFSSCIESGKIWSREFECSSPSVFRRHHMAAYPLRERGGLLVSCTTVVAEPHDVAERPPLALDRTRFVDANGIVTQCAECRRLRHPEGLQWHWVPEALERPLARTSHGLCAACVGQFLLQLDAL